MNPAINVEPAMSIYFSIELINNPKKQAFHLTHNIYNARQKSWDTSHIFNLDETLVPPSPIQCWFLGEVHEVTEKFFVHNNARCLRNTPTLF